MKGESLCSRMYSADPKTYSLINIQNATKKTETLTKTFQNVGPDPFKKFFNFVGEENLFWFYQLK